jgi:hypothetical protein
LEDVATEIVRTEVDGVPVLWSQALNPTTAPVHDRGEDQVTDGQFSCALAFRVGMADETLATSGITHLTEHLAVFAVVNGGTPVEAFVDATQTVFFSQGEPHDACEFLRRLCRTLGNLPLERIEAEKRVLRAERSGPMGGYLALLRQLRFGAAGHGLAGYAELGLHRIDQDDVSMWAAERFTRDNAVLCLSGPPPPGLELPLAAGRRMPPPATNAMAGLELPTYAPVMESGVTVSFVGERSTSVVAALRLAEDACFRRLRLDAGLIYSAVGTYEPLSATAVHAALAADCSDPDAPAVRDEMLEVLRGLAEDGPAEDVLQKYIAKATAEMPATERSDGLRAAASNELMGRTQESRAQLERELADLSPAAVAEAMRAMLGTAIMAAPPHTKVPAGLQTYQPGPPERLRGERLRKRGWLRQKTDLVFAADGISLIGTAQREAISVRYKDVAALVYRGADRATVVGTNGNTISFNLRAYADQNSLREQLDVNIPSGLVIALDGPLPLSDLIVDQLESTVFVKAELAALAGHLREDETVLNLARADRGREEGLAVITDRRLLYLSTGLRGGVSLVEIERDQITKVGRVWPGISAHSLDIRTSDTRVWFRSLMPKGRASEFAEALQASLAQPNDHDAIHDELAAARSGTD